MGLRPGLGLAAMSLSLAAASLNALAADPGVVATAPTGAGAPAVSAAPTASATTGSQIDGWIADGAASQPGLDGPVPRTIHGEISAGIGTGGYRNVSGVADIPLGQTGDLIVAASSTSGQVRGGRYGGYGWGGDALALGFYGNGAAASGSGCGRQPWDPAQSQAYASPRPMDCGAPPAP